MLDIEHLVQELTLQEKVSLLAGLNQWQTVPVPRLGVPLVTMTDGPNGIRGTRFFSGVPANCLPCGTAMASTFNKALLGHAGEVMAKEAKLKNAHCLLGPTCNIARGPLGGRAFELYLEDPYLSGHMATAVVQGIQRHGVVACLKHFVCNDQEDERMGVSLELSERALREVYLKPFQMTVRDARPKLIMTAYNRVLGEHVLQLRRLLAEVLRGEWQWEGLVMSDWWGVYLTRELLEAGLNLEMPGPTRFRVPQTTEHAVVNHEIYRDVIDGNVRLVLRFINDCLAAGLDPHHKEEHNDSPEDARFLRELAGEGIVLLKNERNMLPLSAGKRAKLAVLGPNAKAARNSGGGSASLNSYYTVTPWDGIEARVKAAGGAVELSYSRGAWLDKTLPDIGMQLASGGKPGLRARFYKHPPGTADRGFIEEFHATTSRMSFSDYQLDQLPEPALHFYVDVDGEYTPEKTAEYWIGCACVGTAQIFVDGELVVDNKTKQVFGGAYYSGTGTREERAKIHLEKGRTYQLRVECGTAPTSQLPSQYVSAGGVNFGIDEAISDQQALADAVAAAKDADAVVLVVGLSKEWESEGFDRPDMDIPGWTNKLVSAVARANANVVVVNQSGSPVSMPWVDEVPAVVQAWYGGNELGNAIADVLFGAVNPCGKLALTFPRRLEDNPSYLNFGSTHGAVLYGEDVYVGYRYYDKIGTSPLFAFGHGLLYTTFAVDSVLVSHKDDKVAVSAKVTNTGSVAGAEVVQVYVAPVSPRIGRPVKELRDFAKVRLDPGESQTVHVTLPVLEATAYWDNYNKKWLSEKGRYRVLVGTASDRIVGEGDFHTDKDVHFLGA